MPTYNNSITSMKSVIGLLRALVLAAIAQGILGAYATAMR